MPGCLDKQTNDDLLVHRSLLSKDGLMRAGRDRRMARINMSWHSIWIHKRLGGLLKAPLEARVLLRKRAYCITSTETPTLALSYLAHHVAMYVTIRSKEYTVLSNQGCLPLFLPPNSTVLGETEENFNTQAFNSDLSVSRNKLVCAGGIHSKPFDAACFSSLKKLVG
jgi:hypothetical protein